MERLQPKEFYTKWMDANFPIRPDQRECHQFREVNIVVDTITTADSSSTVKLGDTTVVTGIKAEVAEPSLTKPNQGSIAINVTLAAGCAPSVRAGPPTSRAQLLSTSVSKLLHSYIGSLVDSLVIEQGKMVWCLHIDSMVISDAGNVFDAVWLSLLSALKNLKLPSISFDESTGLVSADSSKCIKLPVPASLPLPLSFVYFENKNVVMFDPSFLEEDIFGVRSGVLLVDQMDHQKIVYSRLDRVPIAATSGVTSLPHVLDHLKAVRIQLE